MMRLPWRLVIHLVAIVASLVAVASARSQDLKSLEPKDGLVCLLVNKNSGRCLSTAGRSAEAGARIVQGPMPEDAGPTERWKLIATGNAYRLRNEQSGLVLEIGSANLNKGVQAIQWHDHETRPNQLWTFEPVDDFYLLR